MTVIYRLVMYFLPLCHVHISDISKHYSELAQAAVLSQAFCCDATNAMLACAQDETSAVLSLIGLHRCSCSPVL